MKLIPSYDVAVVCLQLKIELHFAEIPDMQIANDLHNLTTHRGISMLDRPLEKQQRQRLNYSINVSPVFDLEVAARTIASYLSLDHGLNVRLLFDRAPEKLVSIS